jgi:hypothetical protein
VVVPALPCRADREAAPVHQLTCESQSCGSRQIRMLEARATRWQERHNLAVLESWDELIDNVGPRPGMFVGRPRYALVCSFVEGFGAAKNDDVLNGFQQWLSSQPRHRAICNFAWSSLLLHEVFPERDRVIKPSWQEDPATADPSPEDDTQAIAHLFARLQEYLGSRPTSGGTE